MPILIKEEKEISTKDFKRALIYFLRQKSVMSELSARSFALQYNDLITNNLPKAATLATINRIQANTCQMFCDYLIHKIQSDEIEQINKQTDEARIGLANCTVDIDFNVATKFIDLLLIKSNEVKNDNN